MTGSNRTEISDFFRNNSLVYKKEKASETIADYKKHEAEIQGLEQIWEDQKEEGRINLALFLERLKEEKDIDFTLSDFGDLLTMSGDSDNRVNFAIPKYQRHYSWDISNLRDFWQEILEIAQASEEEISKMQRTEYNSYFGTIYLSNQESKRDYKVIDGQQRLITVMLLYRVLIKRIKEIKEECKEKEEYDLMMKVDSLIIKIGNHLYDSGYDERRGVDDDLRPRIESNYQHKCKVGEDEEKDFLRVLLNSEEVQKKLLKDLEEAGDARKSGVIFSSDYIDNLHLDLDSDQYADRKKFSSSNINLLEAYDFFYGKLDEDLKDMSLEEKHNVLRNIFKVVNNVFKVGRFKLTRDNETLQMKIFQGLNDKGLDLDTVDIVNARVNDAHQRWGNEGIISDWKEIRKTLGNDNEEIEKFLTSYISAWFNGRIPKSSEDEDEDEMETLRRSDASSNLKNFFMKREYVGDDSNKVVSILKNGNERKAERFFERGKDFAEYYAELKGQRDTTKQIGSNRENERIMALVERVDDMAKQWVPLGLAAFYAYDKEESFKAEDFETLFECIENMIFRYKITGESPNSKEKAYADICHKLNVDMEAGRLRETMSGDKIEDVFYNKFSKKSMSLFSDELMMDASMSLWDSNKEAKMLLQSLFYRSEDLETGSDMFLNEDINLEHILPETHLLDIKRFKEDLEEVDKFYWYKKYFTEPEKETFAESEEVQEVIDMIEEIIDEGIEKEGAEEALNQLIRPLLYDIGNLMLLPKDKNKEASNKPFFSKILIYNTWPDMNKTPGSDYFEQGRNEAMFNWGEEENKILQAFTEIYKTEESLANDNIDEEKELENLRDKIRDKIPKNLDIGDIRERRNLDSLKRDLEIYFQRSGLESESDTWNLEKNLERKKKILNKMRLRFQFDKEDEMNISDGMVLRGLETQLRDAKKDVKDSDFYNDNIMNRNEDEEGQD